MTAVVGTRLRRKEDPPLLTGEARFVADLVVPGALQFALVRSNHANARITAIDTKAAAAMPGVVAVFTGADLVDEWAAPMPCAWPVTDDMKNPVHYPLAVDHACYVGDALAVVVAHTAYEAATRSKRWSSTTTRCRRWWISKKRWPTRSCSTPISAPTRRTPGS